MSGWIRYARSDGTNVHVTVWSRCHRHNGSHQADARGIRPRGENRQGPYGRKPAGPLKRTSSIQRRRSTHCVPMRCNSAILRDCAGDREDACKRDPTRRASNVRTRKIAHAVERFCWRPSRRGIQKRKLPAWWLFFCPHATSGDPHSAPTSSSHLPNANTLSGSASATSLGENHAAFQPAFTAPRISDRYESPT